MLSNDRGRETEIKEKIMTGDREFYASKKLLRSRILDKKTKINVYKTIIRLSIMY